MAKANREAALNELSSRLFSAMVGEIIMDSAMQAQQEIVRGRMVCDMCKTRCGEVHVPGAANSTVAGSSKAPSPSPAASESIVGREGGTPAPGNKADSNNLLECVNCQRQIASNRYAQHLASCMGLGTGVRRTVPRNAATRLGEGGRSSSPYVELALDDIDDPKPNKAKSKPKSGGGKGLDASGSGQKRPASPLLPPSKKTKKGRPQVPRSQSFVGERPAPAPPSSRPGPPSSHPKPPTNPSKLRTTPTPSQVHSAKSKSKSRSRSHSSDSSASSHPQDGDGARGGSGSSSSEDSSPIHALPSSNMIGRSRRGSASSHNKNSAAAGRLGGTGPPPLRRPPSSTVARLPSPPKPAVPMQRVLDVDYLIDVEGEETGSSSDTDD